MRKDEKQRRRVRIRAKIEGSADRPRASVYRSNTEMYVQFIDDALGKTLLAFDTRGTKKDKRSKVEVAQEAGKKVAQEALKNKISKIVFDRGGYRYQGRVKALADGMRDGGLEF